MVWHLHKWAPMIYDNYGRPTLNLRIALTQRCNLRCLYCHREGELSPSVEMSLDEILKITCIALKLGIFKFKLTGGEPLLRSDILQMVKGIAELRGVRDLSMVTNGTLLSPVAKDLREAGLDRVNVSLPTLSSETYVWLTGGDLNDAIDGVKAAVEAGLSPVKLNMLMLKRVNEGEVSVMIDFAGQMGAILQIIELEPINVASSFYHSHHQPLDAIEAELLKRSLRVRTRRYMQNRKVYSLPETDVELIRPTENTEFCYHCTRIRTTSDGKIKPCLMRNDNLVDFVMPFRKGASDETLTQLFTDAIKMREPYYGKLIEPLANYTKKPRHSSNGHH